MNIDKFNDKVQPEEVYEETPIGQQLGDGFEDDLTHQGWPGDGSGMDDLADLNANEAMDYSNEG
jgi:hypothetical protein